jgi:hypothetical protein
MAFTRRADALLPGLKLEKLSRGARRKDFAVRDHFRTSE